jgi:iron complex transport system substrate-binding protein
LKRWLPALAALTLSLSMPAQAVRPAHRIVTLAPHLAELVCAAGGCDRLVGVVAFSDYPASVKKLPQVGDAFAVNVEQVIALRPDLVLAWDGGTPREVRERLQGLQLRVEAIRVRRLEDVAEALLHVGALVGGGASAMNAARDYESRLSALRLRYNDARPLRVMYQIEANPAYSVNQDSPISQAMELCGGQNIFADLPALAGVVSREAAVARDPQVIIYSKQDDGGAIRELWARSPPVAATRAGTLYAIDGNLLDRATPRLLDGAQQLCDVLSDARAKLRATGPRPRDATGPARAP